MRAGRTGDKAAIGTPIEMAAFTELANETLKAAKKKVEFWAIVTCEFDNWTPFT